MWVHHACSKTATPVRALQGPLALTISIITPAPLHPIAPATRVFMDLVSVGQATTLAIVQHLGTLGPTAPLVNSLFFSFFL